MTESNSSFSTQRLYIKDLSFEIPNAPAIFQKEWQPTLQLDVNSTSQTLEPHTYEVVLCLTATVKTGDEIAFLIEVKQAGIFAIQGLPEAELAHVLGGFCPQMLFPYAREVISNEVVRGSFPPLVLAPINFEALYFQKLSAAQGAAPLEAQKAVVSE